jgi:hypothetical protein
MFQTAGTRFNQFVPHPEHVNKQSFRQPVAPDDRRRVTVPFFRQLDMTVYLRDVTGVDGVVDHLRRENVIAVFNLQQIIGRNRFTPFPLHVQNGGNLVEGDVRIIFVVLHDDTCQL